MGRQRNWTLCLRRVLESLFRVMIMKASRQTKKEEEKKGGVEE